MAGEGGTSQCWPGATATLTDLPGLPAWFSSSRCTSTTTGSASGRSRRCWYYDETWTRTRHPCTGRRTHFRQTVLGVALHLRRALPYTWLDISGNVQLPAAARGAHSDLGLRQPGRAAGDAGLEDGRLAESTPCCRSCPDGSYEKGRLATRGSTTDVRSRDTARSTLTKASGFNAMAHCRLRDEHRKPGHDYQSGSLLHFEGVIQQIIPLGSGFLTLVCRSFYFEQITATAETAQRSRLQAAGRTAGFRCWLYPAVRKETLVCPCRAVFFLFEGGCRTGHEEIELEDYICLKMVLQILRSLNGPRRSIWSGDFDLRVLGGARTRCSALLAQEYGTIEMMLR